MNFNGTIGLGKTLTTVTFTYSLVLWSFSTILMLVAIFIDVIIGGF